MLDRALQRGARVLALCRGADDLPVQGLAAGERHAHHRAARQQARPGKPPVRCVDERFRTAPRWFRAGPLGDRIGFTGEARLVGLQIVAADDDPVGGKGFGREDDGHVAGHQLEGRDLQGRAVADDGGALGQAALEALRRDLRAAVEERVHADQRHDGREQDERFRDLAEHAVERAHAGQEPDHGILEGVASEIPPAARRRLDDVVDAVALPPLAHLCRREPPLGRQQPFQPRQRDRPPGHPAAPATAPGASTRSRSPSVCSGPGRTRRPWPGASSTRPR